MVVLACIVVACSARLEILDLDLDWGNSTEKPFAQTLLVGQLSVSVSACTVLPKVGLLKEVLSCCSTHFMLCSLWQFAAASCRQLQSLHLAVWGAEHLQWPGEIRYAEWTSTWLGRGTLAEEYYDLDIYDPRTLDCGSWEEELYGIDIFDPWQMVARKR